MRRTRDRAIVIAGTLAGLVVLGLGGRIAMRIVAYVTPEPAYWPGLLLGAITFGLAALPLLGALAFGGRPVAPGGHIVASAVLFTGLFFAHGTAAAWLARR